MEDPTPHECHECDSCDTAAACCIEGIIIAVNEPYSNSDPTRKNLSIGLAKTWFFHVATCLMLSRGSKFSSYIYCVPYAVYVSVWRSYEEIATRAHGQKGSVGWAFWPLCFAVGTTFCWATFLVRLSQCSVETRAFHDCHLCYIHFFIFLFSLCSKLIWAFLEPFLTDLSKTCCRFKTCGWKRAV